MSDREINKENKITQSVFGLVVVFAIFIFANIFIPLQAFATINKQINYQGKLTTPSNVAVTDGSYNVQFNLYTVSSGGSPIWTETFCYSPDNGVTCNGTGVDQRVSVANGLFSTMLGSVHSLVGIDFNQTLYLGVTVSGAGTTPTGESEMTPRKIIGSVPSAFVADTLQGLASSSFLRADAPNSTSSASTFLSVAQTGAGKIAEFFGLSSNSVFSILSSGNINATGTLNIAGAGSFSGLLSALNFTGTSTGSNTGDLTLGTTNGLSLSSQALSLALSATDATGALSSTDWNTFNDKVSSQWTTIVGGINYSGSNVGIGTTSPNSRLDVYGTINATTPVNGNAGLVVNNPVNASSNSYAIQLKDALGRNNIWMKSYSNGAGAYTGEMYVNNIVNVGYATYISGSSIKIYYNTLLSIQNGGGSTYFGGNVGIGTTTPGSKLSIHDNSGLAGTNPLFTIASSTAAGLSTTTLFTVLGNGNVGIGTGAPTQMLDVRGNLRFDYSSNGSGILGYSSAGNQIMSITRQGTPVNASLAINSYGAIGFSTSNISGSPSTAYKMLIAESGNVGIGTSSPLARLDVYGLAGSSDIFALSSSTNARLFTVSGAGDVTAIGLLSTLNFTGTSTGSNTGDLTIGTGNGLSLTGQALSLALSATGATGALSSTDWNTFNDKVSTTTAASTYVPYTGATGAVNLGAQNFTTTGTLGAEAITGTSVTANYLQTSNLFSDNSAKAFIGQFGTSTEEKIFIGVAASGFPQGSEMGGLIFDFVSGRSIYFNGMEGSHVFKAGSDITFTIDSSGNATAAGTISALNFTGTSTGSNTGDLTLGTSNGLSLSDQALSLALSATGATGALSSTDWNTFNNKVSSQWTTIAGGINYSGGNVGIGTTSPGQLLTVGTTVGSQFLVDTEGTGTFGTTVIKGSATYGAAIGYNASASGDYANALGYSASASGGHANALGYSASASGGHASALGYNASASGTNSIAIGYNSFITTNDATAIGYGATIMGGNSTTAIGNGATIMTAGSDYATAIGYNSFVNKIGAMAIGKSATATHLYSTAIGYGVSTNENYSMVLGGYTGTASETWLKLKHGLADFLTNDITTSGNVGIGTTSPDVKLTVNQSNDTAGIRVYGSSVPTAYFDLYVNSLGNPRFSTPNAMVFQTGNGGLYFRSDATGTFFNDLAARTTDFNGGQMRITNTGNVGIGTTSPATKLHVLAPGQASANAPVDVMTVEIGAPASGTKLGYGPSILFKDLGTPADVSNMARISAVYELPGANYAGALSFSTNSNTNSSSGNQFPVERMRISNSGNVGIGTTTPGQALTVVGTAQFTAVGSGATANDLRITTDGTLTTNTSDQRLKDNIITLSESTLDKVLQLNPVSFTWKKDPSGARDFGFIAQEVQLLFPETVFENPTDGYLGVNYSRFPAILTKAIQELNAKVNALGTSTISAQSLGANSSLISSVTDWVGQKITATYGFFTEITVGKVKINKGIEMKDQDTGTIYCIVLKSGNFVKTEGSCQDYSSATEVVPIVPAVVESIDISTTTATTTIVATITASASSTNTLSDTVSATSSVPTELTPEPQTQIVPEVVSSSTENSSATDTTLPSVQYIQ